MKGYCAVCRVNAGRTHWQTKSHADKLYRRDHPKVKRERIQRIRYASMWAREAEAHQKVRKYRRSRPLDGVARVVSVKSYWRELPPGHHKRNRRRRSR
jgi:hypothetical protein